MNSSYQMNLSLIHTCLHFDEQKIVTYQPAISVNLISVKYVIEALEAKGMIELPAVENNELQAIQEIMKDFQGEITESKSNKLLKDI